jgi:hypothetical protein
VVGEIFRIGLQEKSRKCRLDEGRQGSLVGVPPGGLQQEKEASGVGVADRIDRRKQWNNCGRYVVKSAYKNA